MAIPLKAKSGILDKHGRPIASSNQLVKQAFGMFGSIYEPPNAGRFRPRYYTTQDSEVGVNQYSRDLLLRWSREMAAQQPWIWAGVKTLSLFSVGDQYKPRYVGSNSEWGKEAEAWLIEQFYPNCCVRGPNYDFQTIITLLCENVDVDGDVLLVFGEDDGQPKIQLVPAHRIRTIGTAPFAFSPNDANPTVGPYPDTTVSDGVVYDMKGKPVAYAVQNIKNMVNTAFSDSNGKNVYVSTRNSRLVYQPRFPDRGRGLPTISSGILQAMSVEEIEAYMTEKLKIQSMYAVVEKTPEGEGPLEEEEAYRRAANSVSNLEGFSLASQPWENASQGLRVVNNPAIKYVSCAGGDIKFPAASVSDKESSNFISRLEAHVLSCLGVPHALLFSPDDVSGKMNTSVVEIFNGAIHKRQQLLDEHGKFIIGWALSKAMRNGDLPPNDEEIMTNCFDLTHPQPFSIDDPKVRSADLSDYAAGVKSLDDIAKRSNTTAEKIMAQREKEAHQFFQMAKRISEKEGIDLNIVIQSLRNPLNPTSNQGDI